MKLEQLMEDVPFTLVQGTLETEIEDIIALGLYRAGSFHTGGNTGGKPGRR